MMRHWISLAAGVAMAAAGGSQAQAQSWRDWDLRVTSNGAPERCSDLRVRTSDELAQATESFTLTKSEAPALELNARDRSSVYVRGWDQPNYAVEVCKYATAGSRAAADRALRSIAVSHGGGHVSASGSSDRDARWHVAYFVRAPKDAALNVESGNSPVEARGVSGKLTLRAQNGPVALDGCSGTIDAETVNGPISIHGGSGDIRLRASNGPISLNLAEGSWSGSQLEAHTENGPLSVALPAAFDAGLRIETSGHAPISCNLDACRNARTEGGRLFPRVLEVGSGNAVRLSTRNGPVAVSNTGRRARII